MTQQIPVRDGNEDENKSRPLDDPGVPVGAANETAPGEDKAPDNPDAPASQDDPELGKPQAPQDGAASDAELDTPDAELAPAGEAAPSNQPVPDQDDQEKDNPEASHKPGEAQGRATSEIKAAEKDPDEARKTNPVGEATQHESKDPYAEGKHIANPEPNNGQGVRDEDLDPTERE